MLRATKATVDIVSAGSLACSALHGHYAYQSLLSDPSTRVPSGRPDGSGLGILFLGMYSRVFCLLWSQSCSERDACSESVVVTPEIALLTSIESFVVLPLTLHTDYRFLG